MSGIIPIDGFGGGGGGSLNVPSDQIFNSNAERDSFFVSNPEKLVENAQCVVLTNPPEGLYQVYTSGTWQNRTAVVVGPKGESGSPGEKGDTVKISSVTNELDADGKLKTTVALDDGTSAESVPLQLPEGAEIKSPFTDAQSIQIDVSHLDHPDVTVYVTDGSKLKKVKPAISIDLVSGLLQVDFINPKSGLIVVRSH